jgi:hypothetical protein
MSILRAGIAFFLLFLNVAYTEVDVSRTFKLLNEGEQLSASAAADLETKVGKKPHDLENRLCLLSYYAGQQGASNVEAIRAARLRHVLWLIRNEPKAAVFEVATKVYAIQPTGGAFADPAGYQEATAAWKRQLSAHPNDNDLKRNAATWLNFHDPAWVEELLKSPGRGPLARSDLCKIRPRHRGVRLQDK